MIYKISFENLKESIILPVNPPELVISGGGTAFSDAQVIKGGERTIIGNRMLQSVALSSFFPRDYDPSYCVRKSIPDPWEAVDKINKWRDSGKPVKLLITGTDINMYATIRKFDYREKGGEPGDVYFDIEFKEFRFIKIREVVKTEQKSEPKVEQQSDRPETAATANTYTVVKGDCLWNIAKRFYGSGAQYTKIFAANSPPLENANVIYPGQVLTIPS